MSGTGNTAQNEGITPAAELHQYVLRGESGEGAAVLLDIVDDLLIDGKFEEAAAYLEAIDLQQLDTRMLVVVLTLSNWFKEDYPARVNLVDRIVKRMTELAPDRIEGLTKGLL